MQQTQFLMSMIIAGSLMILLYIAFIIHTKIKPTVNTGTKTSPTSGLESTIAVDNHNKIMTEFSKAQYAFRDTVNTVSMTIVSSQDNSAAARLNEYIRQYNELSGEITDYLQRSAECISRKEYAGSAHLISLIEENIEKINALKSFISTMEIEKQVSPDDFLDDLIDNSPSLAFFDGCNCLEDIEARYRSLAKAFHPDNKGGDKVLFERMITEYNQAKKEIYG